MLRVNWLILGVAAGMALGEPAMAADGMTPGSIFADATVPIKVVMILLVAAMIGAVVIAVRKAMAKDVSGGSAYLSALRMGGPLLGLLGAALNGLWSFIGIATIGKAMPLEVYAPGLAEAAFVLSLGLLSGVVAVVCNWVVEARIDRAVLKA